MRRILRFFIFAATLASTTALFTATTVAQDLCRVFLNDPCADMVVGGTQILNAAARPGGGSFSWNATFGAANIQPTSGSDATFTFDAIAPGVVELTVTYTTSLGCIATTACSFRVYGDSDGDGIPNFTDLCPYLYDPGSTDSDGDGTPDICEPAANCYISDLAIGKSFAALNPAIIENTGFVTDAFYYEIYQSGGNSWAQVDPVSGTLPLTPGESAEIPFVFSAFADPPPGVANFTLVVISSSGKLVSSCDLIIQILATPPPPPPVKVDLIAHKPKVLHPGEPAVLENAEEDPGVTTFLNNDNDDDDDYFDLDENDTKVAGDDELVKVILRIQPATLADGNLKLKATKGAANIRAWKKADKDTAFADITNISIPVSSLAKSADRQWLETTLWVEGILAHDAARGSVLELTYDGDANAKDSAAITVEGVRAMNWIGKGNGYSPGSDSFHNDVLDTADPNFPAGDLKSHAVFPDGRSKDVTGVATDAPGNVNDKVLLEVVLTCAPPEKLELYVRALDIDDPSDETTRIDPNDLGGNGNYSGTVGSAISGGTLTFTADEDNRGSVDGKKFGKLDGQDPQGVAKITFDANNAKKSIQFQVSQFAGDNYRVAAHADAKYLKKLRNRDKLDKLEIVDPNTKDFFGDPEPWAIPYSSHVLTVWRMLHVERDSMKAPTPAQNSASGLVEAINNTTKTLTIAGTGVVVNGNLEPSLDFTDKSPGNRRFENGKFVNFAGVAATNEIVSNTGLTFVMKDVVEPACKVSKDEASTDTKVKAISFDGGSGKSTVTVEGPLPASAYDSGTLKIGAHVFPVSSNTATTVLVNGKVILNFIAVDDDTAGLLPEANLADNGHMIGAYSGVYIWPVFDGGGKSTASDTKDANFTANLPKDETAANYVAEVEGFYKRDSAALEADSFWVVYVLSCCQYEYTEDNDPIDEPEGATGGIVVDAVLSAASLAQGGKGCTAYLETIDDRLSKAPVADQADAGLEARIVAHEIGHQFGLAHNTGVMAGSQQKGPAPGGAFQFSDKDKNLLRSRKRSPGQ